VLAGPMLNTDRVLTFLKASGTISLNSLP
jgi:hypothetical protein